MSIAPVNRLAGLLDHPTHFPPTRSPAQPEPSCRNGARSRDPVAAAGHARACTNARKHGLLAKAITPPGDRRHDDELYRSIRDALVAEFNPAGFSDTAAIDALAADYVDLARVRRLIEALLKPQPLPPEENSRLELVETHRGQLEALETMAASLRDGTDLDDAALTEAATILAADLTEIHTALAPSDPNDPDGLDPLPASDQAPLRAVLEALGPRQTAWTKPMAVLAQLRHIGRGSPERSRFLALLDHCIGQRRHRLRWSPTVAVEGRDAEFDLSYARNPAQLMTLRRYQSRIETAAELKVRRLQRPRRVRLDSAL